MDEQKPGAKTGQRYIQLPAELLNRARLIPEMNVTAVCRAAVEAACEAVESGEIRSVTFGFRVVRAFTIETLADPPKPEER